MGAALSRLAQEDPTFVVALDPESGQTVIRGMGELHLEIIVDRMKREFKVDANVGVPQVAYREAIARAVEIDHTLSRRVGDHDQFARLKLALEPGEAGSGFCVRLGRVRPGRCRRKMSRLCAADSTQLRLQVFSQVSRWSISRATLIDGSRRGDDDSAAAFEAAARAAFREGVWKAGPILLEPVMRVEIVTPEEYVGDIIGDLNARRGQISGIDQRGPARTIQAAAPLANMFGYINTLRSVSKGRAQYTMQFDHYDPIPQAIADEVRAKLA